MARERKTDPRRKSARGGADAAAPPTKRQGDVTELRLEEIVQHEYSGRESAESPGVKERERATELQFLWSWVAVGLIVVIAGLLALVVLKWFGLERELQTKLLELAREPAGGPQIETYKDISQQTFDKTWRFVDRVILGGLMSLLTLIIGYVFGARRPRPGG